MWYRVLGPLEVRDGERLVSIGGRQQQRLLAALLTEPGRLIGTDRLIEVLWPDGLAPTAASHTVLTYVHRLRSSLGDGSIVTLGTGYLFEPTAGEVDATHFEDLVAQARSVDPHRAVGLYDRALSLWRGPAFGSLADEWWALAAAERLDELRVAACEDQATSLIATGQAATAVPRLQTLVAEHPLRERPVRLLAQALHATGRQVEALRQLQALRARLADGTGLDPSPEVRELEHSIADGSTGGPSSWPLRGYVIHDVIGEGAFGRVYAATQPGTGREVAVKVVRAELADTDEFVRRFESEAQLVARLEHPHIVPLFDYWREPGGAYLVFRLLRRSARDSLVTGGPWSLTRVSRLVEEIGGALISAHAAGVTHGDVRASNVLLDDEGSTYLIDFGLAVSGDDGEDAPVRRRADVVDLARLLWELLSGVPPAANGKPGRLPSLVGGGVDVPSAVDAVIAETTAPDAGFDSIAELMLAWRAAVGRPEGVLSPLRPDATSSARRLAARRLVAATAGANPYRGLRPFGEADAVVFFGRDAVVDALADQVGAQRFTAIVGPSGCGKSSVLHAGLLARWRQAEGSRVATMVPGDDPIAALRVALSEVAVKALPRRGPAATIVAVAGGAPLLLVVDQFEECWTLATVEARDEFVAALATVAADGGCQVRVVVTIRSDFYDGPLQDPVLGALVGAGTFPIPPMSPGELDEAIVRPAERLGVTFDDGVVAAMVAETAARPATLPMLQFVLAELFDDRVDGSISAASYERRGGLGGAIGSRAEQIYAGLDEESAVSARELFGRLVTPGTGVPDTRRRAKVGELSAAMRAVAEPFVGARLLVADRDQATREPVVEIAHEALLDGWPRLRAWIDEDRRWLQQLQHLAGAAVTWDTAGRPDSELYRGARLEAAIEAQPARATALNDKEVAFIDAGRAQRDAGLQRERRTSRRLRRLLVAAGIALVLALVAGTVAVLQRRQATDARTTAQLQRLASQSVALRGTQRDLAALLAVEAYRRAPSADSRSALMATLQGSPGFMGATWFPGDEVHVDGTVLPQRNEIVVAFGDHRLHTLDPDTGAIGEPWAPFDTGDPGLYEVFTTSADGSVLVDLHEPDIDHVAAAVYDVATRQLVMPPIHPPFFAGSAAISPDHHSLALAGGEDGDLVVYSVPDGREVGRLAGLPRPAGFDLHRNTAAVTYAADGSLVVGSMPGPVRVLDPQTLTVRRTIDAPENTTNNQLLAGADPTLLVGTGALGVVRMDLGSGQLRWTLGVDDLGDNGCVAAALLESIGRLYCGDRFGRLDERDLATGAPTGVRLDPQRGDVAEVATVDGPTPEVVSFGGQTPVVSRWRRDGSGPITRLIAKGLFPVGGGYSPDGRSYLVGDGNTVDGAGADGASIWDPATDHVVTAVQGTLFPAWIDDHRIGGLDPNNGDRTINAYDVDRRAVIPGMQAAFREDLGAVAGADDRSRLFFQQGDNRIVMLDRDLQPVGPTIDTGDVSIATISAAPDRPMIVVSSWDGDAILYDTDSGRELGRFTGPVNVTAIPGGRLVGTFFTGELTVFDADSLAPVMSLPGTRGYVQTFASSSDGRMLLAKAGDHTASLYDLDAGVRLGDPIDIPATDLNDAELRRDGGEMTIGGGPRGIEVWDLDPGNWAAAACRIAGRNLTEQEWTAYLGDLGGYRPTCPDYPTP